MTAFLHHALRLAESSPCRYRHGAVVSRGGRVLARATNRPTAKVLDDHAVRERHAEVAALARVADPRGATVWVARVLADGSPALSAPCPDCVKVLTEAGVRRVVWTQ